MPPWKDEWIGRSATRLSGTFACGVVANRLPEVRRTEMHEGVVVSWLLAGGGSLVQGGARHRLAPGSTCLRRPDRAYSMALDAQTQHVRCFLKLPEDAYPWLCALMPGLADAPAVHPLPYDAGTMRRVVAFIDALGAADDATAYRLVPDAVDLLYALTALAAPPRQQDALARAAAILQEPEHFHLPLPDVADAAGLSYAALRKQFPQRFGTSPGQFRLHRKIELAQQALASGDSIAAVVERYGFSDVYAFTKQFRAQVGETPGQYRRLHIM